MFEIVCAFLVALALGLAVYGGGVAIVWGILHWVGVLTVGPTFWPCIGIGFVLWMLFGGGN